MVFFLNELPEFPRHVLEASPTIETGEVMICGQCACEISLQVFFDRGGDPCKCGFMTDPDQACGRAQVETLFGSDIWPPYGPI